MCVVRSHGSQKLTIILIGPWCGSKTPPDKLKRAAELDAAFLHHAARGKGSALSWTEYVSLAGCKGAEAADGSHFTPDGAAHILDVTIKDKVLQYVQTHQ